MHKTTYIQLDLKKAGSVTYANNSERRDGPTFGLTGVIGEYFFAYSFVEFVLSFLNIFFRESLSNGIFYLLACFMVGGSFYAVFFLFVLIKTIIFKKNSN